MDERLLRLSLNDRAERIRAYAKSLSSFLVHDFHSCREPITMEDIKTKIERLQEEVQLAVNERSALNELRNADSTRTDQKGS